MVSVQSFRQVSSTTFSPNCSTSFAHVALPRQPSVSLIPGYNRFDDVPDSLLSLFFIDYYQICLIYFHSR